MSKFADYPTNVTVTGNSISFLYKVTGLNDAVNVGVVDLEGIGATIDDIIFSYDSAGALLRFGHLEGSTKDYDYQIQIDYTHTTGEYPDTTDTEYIKTLDCDGLTVYAYGDHDEEGQYPYAYNYYEYFVTIPQSGMYWKIQLQLNGAYTDHESDTVVPEWVGNCIDAFTMFINGVKLETTEYAYSG